MNVTSLEQLRANFVVRCITTDGHRWIHTDRTVRRDIVMSDMVALLSQIHGVFETAPSGVIWGHIHDTVQSLCDTVVLLQGYDTLGPIHNHAPLVPDAMINHFLMYAIFTAAVRIAQKYTLSC